MTMWFSDGEWMFLSIVIWTGLITLVAAFFGVIGLIGWGLYKLFT